MKHPLFNHWSETKYIKDIVTNPLIEVGEYSYYSGYYGHQNFEDGCVRYLWGDAKSQALFNPIEQMGWHLDKLIIGNYVCIASGVVILMGGNHNHHSNGLQYIHSLSKLNNHMKLRAIQSLKVMLGLE
ncbi:hypothetical protein IGM_02873 [Bacillus cereus HuB4-4]|uniref:Type B chloramphenicol O-acetyltransferase n=1 Tax=Bacillus cereus HuB4-4 TaxID=1053211 RepID=A0A9W5QUT0_BACCE|nr:hypothetical protein IGM_02873 [Bacillus cereus HuB4-4]